jgi:hypothetical protein
LKPWKRWKRTLQLIFHPTTRQIAAAIRLGETKERNRAARVAQHKPDVWLDKAWQAQAHIAAYEPPEKRTDPAQLSIRRRAMTRQLQENHLYMHHHHAMLKKAQMVKLEPETMMVPAVTAPEDDWTNGGADQTARRRAV